MPISKVEPVRKLSIVKVEKVARVEVAVPKSHHQTPTPIPHTFWERRARPRLDDWAEWLAAEVQAQEYGSG